MNDIHYCDEEGNEYFIRAGIGNVYKGFIRRSNPQKGQRKETGIRVLSYTFSREQAQECLNKYAVAHKLKPIKNKEGKDDGAPAGKGTPE